MKNNSSEKLTDLELLDSQDYKNYILYSVIDSGYKMILIKLFTALLLGYIFDYFNILAGSNFLVSYIVVEILFFNIIDKTRYRP